MGSSSLPMVIMKPLFLQYANNETLQGMIEDHAERHIHYCERHDYHYFPVIRLGAHFDWFDKIRLILDAVKSGNYSHVFWIDADCFIVDGAQDMRDTLPQLSDGDDYYCPSRYTAYAFTIHPRSWHGQSYHFNAGVMYYASDECSGFLEAVLSLEGLCADEYDQTAINDLLLGAKKSSLYPDAVWQDGLSVLPDKWNCTLGVHDLSPDNPPVLAAFHGHEFPERRREVMREWAERLPYR